jgi:predicted  nucleic acid-binding Zn-ribbon protein
MLYLCLPDAAQYFAAVAYLYPHSNLPAVTPVWPLLPATGFADSACHYKIHLFYSKAILPKSTIFEKLPPLFSKTKLLAFMKRVYVCIYVLFMFAQGFAQPVNILNDSSRQWLRNFSILPDSNYSFDRILADTTLPFTNSDSLVLHPGAAYWVKMTINNPSGYARQYSIFESPVLDNTVYHYDHDAKKWIATQTGALTAARARLYGIARCTFQGGADNTLYVRMNTGKLGQYSNPGFVRAYFLLQKQEYVQQQEQLSWTICIATVILVLLFLLYNAIIWYHTRDRTYLYYLLIQLGGIIYCIAAIDGFNYLIPWQGLSYSVTPNGDMQYFNLNTLCNRMSTLIIIIGYVQFARQYLQTKQHLPRLDKLIKWMALAFGAFQCIHTLLNFFGRNQNDRVPIMITNLVIAALVLLILVMAVAAASRRIYAARYFLWANMASLLLILALAVYYIFNNGGIHKIWLPGAALVMQALMFAMALVARLRLVREQLATTQSEAEQLKKDIEQLEQQHQQLTAEHQQIEQAMQQEKSRNDVLEDKLAANNRQLASASLYIVQKNELLTQLKTNIKSLGKKLPHGSKDLDSIESNLQSNQFLDNDWEKFKLHFEQVHPRFFEELKSKYPNLTQYETRLCAYFHMNLSTKEIAGLLNIDPASVRKAKTRLGKKINIAFLNSS